jgi:hypothetical protein
MSEETAVPTIEPAGEAPPAEMPAVAEPVEQEAEPSEAQKEAERVYKQEEVDRLVNKVRRNARYLARKEAEADIYARMAAAGGITPPEKPAAPTLDKPARNAYASDEDYIAALARHEARTEIHGQRTQAAEAEQKAIRDRSLNEFQARTELAREKLPDFDEVVGMSDAPMSQAMAEAIVDSDVGPQLTYHLAKNPQEAARIAGLSPVKAIREIAMIEAKLKAPAAPTVKATSAPPPPTHVSSRSASAVSKDPSRMSMDEYVAWTRTRGY